MVDLFFDGIALQTEDVLSRAEESMIIE